MPNSTGRARHLTMVPDIPAEMAAPVTTRRRVSAVSASSAIAKLVLHVELVGSNPVMWHKLEVRSDLLLPELHGVLQAVMGWPGHERYEFTAADATYRARPAIDTGPRDVRAEHVRVDSLLATEDDALRYTCAGRILSVRLESIDHDIDDLRPLCLDASAERPSDAAVGHLRPSTHVVDDANRRIGSSWTARSTEVESIAASPLVAGLFRAAHPAPVPRLLELLPRCELTIESSIDLPVATIAMAKVSWFLRLVGSRGLALTDDGHLPPAAVEAIRDELDWGIGWHGASAREIDHHQARDLREAARNLGLVRVSKAMLRRTRAGEALVDDPIALWNHCAARLPLGRREHEHDAGTLFLVALAASASARHRDVMVVETMSALGWGEGALDAFEVQKAAHPTVALLDLIGAHGPLYYLARDGSDAPGWSRRFARDALRTTAQAR